MRRSVVFTLALVAWLAPAHATQTDPVLAIVAARVVGSPTGQWIQIDAAYPSADMLQQPIPVQVLLRDLGGTSYARFALGDGAYTGSAASLGDGLDAADVPDLLASGAPMPGAEVLHAGATRIELWVPDLDLDVGEVQLFLVYEGEAILSNPVAPADGLP